MKPIHPSLSPAVGLKRASARVERSGRALVAATTPINDTSALSPAARNIVDGGPERAVTDHIESVNAYRAAAKVAKMSDERFETLLDIMR